MPYRSNESLRVAEREILPKRYRLIGGNRNAINHQGSVLCNTVCELSKCLSPAIDVLQRTAKHHNIVRLAIIRQRFSKAYTMIICED